MLDEAEINSPLTGLSAASSTEDLGPVSAEELWREGFEGPQQRLSVTGDCDRTYDDLRGGFVLACRNEGQAGAVAFNINLRGGKTFKRFIRFNFTPVLDAGATDEAIVIATAVMGGKNVL